ncbi:MAG TPA: hypothetical protein VKM55_28885 [Candidatus Lokiarchaeia archaeon]|nr:hypothetical protein [Candidatus Lokiarchaeia archaeon]
MMEHGTSGKKCKKDQANARDIDVLSQNVCISCFTRGPDASSRVFLVIEKKIELIVPC